ncbi:hypothetical protein FFK22_041920 [Mycobacterium sp. KBS0706]|nr:hypothetical protein FFK22_041920 [Mycobacterium sp. KBS0706]
MARHLFAGALTRFFSNDWLTELDVEARATGTEIRQITPDGRPVGKTNPELIEPNILAWRDYITKQLLKNAGHRVQWQEGMLPPYATGSMGWPALGALYVWAAYAEDSTIPPERAIDAPFEDPVFLARSSADDGFELLPTLLCAYWLPCPAGFLIECQGPLDGEDRIIVGSTGQLRFALNRINETTWKASPDEIAAWRARYAQDRAPVLMRSARYAYSVFCDVLAYAERNELPIRLRI